MELLLKKPCKKCGGLEATKAGACKDCVSVYQKDYAKRWRIKNPEYFQIAVKEHSAKISKTLSKSYVKSKLADIARDVLKQELTSADIPEELIEVKSLQLQLTRLIRTKSLSLNN